GQRRADQAGQVDRRDQRPHGGGSYFRARGRSFRPRLGQNARSSAPAPASSSARSDPRPLPAPAWPIPQGLLPPLPPPPPEVEGGGPPLSPGSPGGGSNL